MQRILRSILTIVLIVFIVGWITLAIMSGDGGGLVLEFAISLFVGLALAIGAIYGIVAGIRHLIASGVRRGIEQARNGH